MDHQILEKVFKRELELAGERWVKKYKIMGDKERFRLTGCFAARRLISEEIEKTISTNVEPEEKIYRVDPELIGTQGPLGHCSGGGRRVIRETKTH